MKHIFKQVFPSDNTKEITDVYFTFLKFLSFGEIDYQTCILNTKRYIRCPHYMNDFSDIYIELDKLKNKIKNIRI